MNFLNIYLFIYLFILLSAGTTSLFVCGAEDRTQAARMPGKHATA